MRARDLLYREGEQLTAYELEKCRLDIYPPTAPMPGKPLRGAPQGGHRAPYLVWFHGGGLEQGDRSGEGQVAAALNPLGIGVALCSYRLKPQVGYPAYIDDARTAFRRVRRQLDENGQAGSPLFIGGHSAGAYLAALVTMTNGGTGWEGEPVPAGLISVAGQLITHFAIRQERGIPAHCVVVDEDAPLHYVRAEAPPLYLLVSAQDMEARLEENAYFAASMRLAGHTHTTFHVFQNRDHGSIGELMGAPGDEVAPRVAAFIHNPLAPVEPPAGTP